MQHLSQTNRKILEESLNLNLQKIPEGTKKIVEYITIKDESYDMKQKFKNLEDPFSYIHTEQIQKLKNSANYSSQALHHQMDQIMELSKSAYKRTISREANEHYDFQSLRQKDQFGRPLHGDSFQPIRPKTKKSKRDEENKLVNQFLGGNSKYRIQIPSESQNKFKNLRIKSPRRPAETLQQLQDTHQQTLNFSHIKLIDTPEFDSKCENVEFYNMLKSNRQTKNHPVLSELNLNQNNFIQKAANNIQFQLIQKSIQHSHKSQQIFFDFYNNLKIWKTQDQFDWRSQHQDDTKQKKIMSFCAEMDINAISPNVIYDFAMKKITIPMLAKYSNLKKDHKKKLSDIAKDSDDLNQLYEDLKRQYEFVKESRKTKSQLAPVKYVNSESQTIYVMENKQFENYFAEDIRSILQKLFKFNKLRQKTLKNLKNPKNFILLKNICIDMKDYLFKLLTMMLKGQKFYRYGNDQNPQAPYFTYSDFICSQNKDEVQKRILDFVYTHIDKFEINTIDSIPKSEIIKIYADERQKNDKLLEILESS